MNYKNFMKIWCTSILLFFSSSAHTTAATPEGKTFIPASDPNIVYTGRISHSTPDNVRFTYPGVTISANFEGTSLQMKVKPNSGSFMVEIDNLLPYRINFHKNDSIQTLAEGLPQGIHSARIMYIVEGYELRPAFKGFYLDSNCKLSNVPQLPERKIEFIGNSITCGFGIESEAPDDSFSYDTENHFYTYAAQTARALNARHLVVARSGIGVYRNVGGPKTGSKDCLPALYEQTLFNDSTEKWDHNRFIPDVVCVNLGTNDASSDNYDLELLTDGYRKFVKRLREFYPQAKIVLLSGSMQSGKQLTDTKNAMNKVVQEYRAQGDLEIYRFDMSRQDGSLGFGAAYHPSIRQQQKMASELTAYLKRLMKWD